MTTRTGTGEDGLEYDVVDVFTTDAFAGNPLAVVYGAASLASDQMQSIAREFNLSETAFPLLPPGTDVGDADYRLRIFTPQTELPFAGHPSVGAAWALADRGLVRGRSLRQLCGAGVVGLDLDGEDGLVWLTGAAPRVGAEIDPVPALAAVGLATEDLVGVASVTAGAGLDFSYLLVRPGSIARAMPDLHRLRQLRCQGPTLGGVAIVGWHDDTARVRVFTDDIGAAEDPATGSAALGLGAVLVWAGLLPGDGPSRFTVQQGIEMGRPSTLRCRVEASGGAAVGCAVGGQVVPVATGRIAVPGRT